MRHVTIKDYTEVQSATFRYTEYSDPKPLDIVDDWGIESGLYLLTMDVGYSLYPQMLIRASSWEDAYYTAIDNMPCIDDDDVPEVYSCSSHEELEKLFRDAACGVCEYPELESGYMYQDNAGAGNGIVYTEDLHLHEVTKDLLDAYRIELTIGRVE